MKNIVLLIIFALGFQFGETIAQAQPNISLKEKMNALSSWEGRWQGEGYMRMGPGEPKKSIVDEHVEFKLDRTLVVVEGVGKAKDTNNNEVIVHHAFGIVSFDQASNEYKFRTYLKDGKGTDAWLNIIEENKFQWGFDTPRGKIRYSINIDSTAKTWNEIGEIMMDGVWRKFFEMNLKKQSQ